jgi:NAD(P)-dependent dehydrogenase (short-subunit alcohol dehydrogenase family)
VTVGLLDGKVAVVTGGASGLGRGVCIRFAEEGAKAVIVADIREDAREGGDPTHVLVDKAGSKGVFVRIDASKPADLERAVAAADEFGGIDVLVNNAGIAFQEDFFTIAEDDYDRLMDVNVKGVYFGAQAAARRMRGRGGSIINISSIGGIKGSGAMPVYCTSKGAVRLLSYALGDLLGKEGIRVNAIHPGLMDTSMNRSDLGYVGAEGESRIGNIPVDRTGQPADIGDAAVFLASDLASYVNATSLVVDGGRLAV